MTPTEQQQQIKIEWYKDQLKQSELARNEQREELSELYEYCEIIEDILCAKSNRRLQ